MIVELPWHPDLERVPMNKLLTRSEMEKLTPVVRYDINGDYISEVTHLTCETKERGTDA